MLISKSWLANIIDTSWYSSWHWECDSENSSNLTRQGMAQALNDCRAEQIKIRIRLKKLAEADLELCKAIATMDKYAADEEE